MTDQLVCPRSQSDITATWLTQALQAQHPGVAVTNLDVEALTQGTSTRMRVRARYADNGASVPPDALFIKTSFDNDFRDMMTAAGIYKAEVMAFSDLLGDVGARTPHLYAAAIDDADGQFVLVMEDVVESGVTWYPPGGPISVDRAAQVLADMADWHGRFWADPSLDTKAWLPSPLETAEHATTQMFVQASSEVLQQQWPDRSPAVLHDPTSAARLFRTAMTAASEGPRTLIHGDPHLGNIGLLDDEPLFVDWQVVRRGHAALDLAYFLTMSLDIEDRRAHEKSLLQTYLARRSATSDADSDFERLWNSYRAHALYGLIVWAATPEFMQPSTVTSPYVSRALAALEDLDTIEAINSL